MKHITAFQDFLTEGFSRDRIFVEESPVGMTLWLSYSPGSGITAHFKSKDFFFRTYITDKKDDKNYDSIVNNILSWANSNKAVKAKKIGYSYERIYEIPVYRRYDRGLEYGQIFRQEEAPDSKAFMKISTMTTGSTVIGFFKTLREASNF